MAKRRCSVSLKRHPAMRVTRVTVGKQKLCYLLVVDKKLIYPDGRSRIAYIGTTKKGLTRISQSVAAKAEEALGLRGVSEFEARVVTCSPRSGVKTWRKLERALLLEFRGLFGEVPKLNKHGVRMKETDEFRYFARIRVRRVIEDTG